MYAETIVNNKEKLRNKVRRKFNKFIQLRDLEVLPNGDIRAKCISCGRKENIDISYQLKDWHAGHYFREKGSDKRESVALDEVNVNLQCAKCNKYLSGNESNYQIGLIRKYGQKEFDNLVIRSNQIKIYSYGELEELDKRYSKKIKEQQERINKKW